MLCTDERLRASSGRNWANSGLAAFGCLFVETARSASDPIADIRFCPVLISVSPSPIVIGSQIGDH